MDFSYLVQFKKRLKLEDVIFLTAIFAFVCYFFVQVLILKSVYPQISVQTTSMTPTYQGYDLTELQTREYYDIFRGDVLIIQNKEPHVGDTAIFQTRDPITDQPLLVIHRLVAEQIVNNTIFFATKGDNNPLTDVASNFNNYGWIAGSDILGVVVFSVHHLGWFLFEFSQLGQFVITNIIYIAILVVIGYYFFNYRKQVKKSKGKSKPQSNFNLPKKIHIVFSKWNIDYTIKMNVLILVLLMIFPLLYGAIGFSNYFTSTNQAVLDPTSDQAMLNGLVDLRYSTAFIEKYSNGIFYNYHLKISSSGTFNFVDKVVIAATYNNYSLSNPDYIWTIVYDFYGTKIINAVQFFNTTNMPSTPLTISTTLTIQIYSAGLLAQAPVSHFVNFNLMVK